MSFWSWLRPVGDLVAAPFTGGATLADLPASLSSAFGSMGGGGDEGGGLGSAWGDDGTFTGDSTFGSVQDGGSGSSGLLALAMKYGLPALAGAIKSGQMNSQAQQQLELLRGKLAEETAARKQTAALDESKLDPFRGYMAQARDVGKLDMQAEGNFTSSPVQGDAKYGRGLNVQPEQFYTPSTLMRTVARGNRDAVASGKTVPTMTDPANYGKMPVGTYGAGDSGAAPPPGRVGGPATAILAALRDKGLLQDDDTQQSSPWLA